MNTRIDGSTLAIDSCGSPLALAQAREMQGRLAAALGRDKVRLRFTARITRRRLDA